MSKKEKITLELDSAAREALERARLRFNRGRTSRATWVDVVLARFLEDDNFARDLEQIDEEIGAVDRCYTCGDLEGAKAGGGDSCADCFNLASGLHGDKQEVSKCT